MKQHKLVTEVKGKRYETILRNVKRIFSDNVRYTIQFTDGQGDHLIPKSKFICFGDV